MPTPYSRKVDTADSLINSEESGDKVPEYLSKPTIIMCNPNALVYQQMITSPNAYWLHFFLRREINVVCWNYRGYGESESGCCN